MKIGLNYLYSKGTIEGEVDSISEYFIYLKISESCTTGVSKGTVEPMWVEILRTMGYIRVHFVSTDSKAFRWERVHALASEDGVEVKKPSIQASPYPTYKPSKPVLFIHAEPQRSSQNKEI